MHKWRVETKLLIYDRETIWIDYVMSVRNPYPTIEIRQRYLDKHYANYKVLFVECLEVVQ